MSENEAVWERLDRAHAQRLALRAGGYVPIPLNGKRPTNTAWQSDVPPDDSEIALWKTMCSNAFNTGILTKWTPAIDIDVMDDIVANAIADRAAELIEEDAPLLVRFGKHPKRAVLFRTTEPFDKIRTSDFTSPDGTIHHVEILCDGQQLVAFGRHPETGNEYEWPRGAPDTIRHCDLPILTPTMAKRFIAAAANIMCCAGWEAKDSKQPAGNGANRQTPRVGKGGYRERQYAKAALDGCAAELANSPPGTRNDALNKVAFRLGTMIARDWIDEKTVFDALLGACNANKYLREHGHRAAMKTIESGIEAGRKEPHPDLPDREPSSGDNRTPLSDLSGSQGVKQKSNGERHAERETGIWEEPDWALLNDRRGDLPDFPTDIFAPPIRGWLERAAHGAGVFPDHVAVPMLGVVASLIGAARRVRASRSWSEPVTLWTALVAASGDRKTLVSMSLEERST